MLHRVDNKTTCAAYSGWLSYSSSKRELFLEVGKELAINNACAVVPSKFRIKITIKAIQGDNISLPRRLKTSGVDNCLIFKKALWAPSVISAIAKNAFAVFSIGVQRNGGMLIDATWKNIPLQNHKESLKSANHVHPFGSSKK